MFVGYGGCGTDMWVVSGSGMGMGRRDWGLRVGISRRLGRLMEMEMEIEMQSGSWFVVQDLYFNDA